MLVAPHKTVSLHKTETAPRLGQINFVNCLPVVIPMQRSDWQKEATVVYATPSELNLAFENNELDIGAMSSFAFLKDGTMRLVEGLSIASDGAVASVMCYSKVPLARLDGATVAVPNSSATSINLLRVLLKESFGVTPKIVQCESPDIDAEGVDAALVIGDRALYAEGLWERKLVKADLGEWWRIVTGLPMVFGLWGAKANWAKANSEQFTTLSANLRQCATDGLGVMFDDVVAEGCARTGMSRERIVKYYRQDLDFRMTDRHMQGLREYELLCAKHGLFK